jgi:type I restriction enzyme, S subunit
MPPRNISQVKIKNVLVPNLPWSDQVIASESVASSCEEIEGLVANYRRKLQLLSELKQSLLQNACSGELTADKEVSNAFDNKEEVA